MWVWLKIIGVRASVGTTLTNSFDLRQPQMYASRSPPGSIYCLLGRWGIGIGIVIGSLQDSGFERERQNFALVVMRLLALTFRGY